MTERERIAAMLAGPVPPRFAEGDPRNAFPAGMSALSSTWKMATRKPAKRVGLIDQALNGTGLKERIGLMNSMFNPVTGLQEAGQHSEDMLAPGKTAMERVGSLGGMLSGMAGTVAPMVAASKGAIPAADAVMEAVAGYSAMPRAVAGDFLADEFGGLRLMGGSDADLTETGWVFRDVKKPDLTPAENKAYNEAAMTGRTEILPIRSMYATQGRVNPDYAVTETSAGTLPKVIRKNGEFFVMDGHHRLTKVADEGGQKARVELFDFDRSEASTPLLDYDAKGAEKTRKEIAKLLAELGL